MTAFDPTRTKPRSTKVAREVYELVTEARRLLIAHGLGVLPPELQGDAFATTTDRHGQQKHPGLSDVFGLGARLLLAEIKRRMKAYVEMDLGGVKVHAPREARSNIEKAFNSGRPVRIAGDPDTSVALDAFDKEAKAHAAGDDAKQVEAMRELAEAEERLRQKDAARPKSAPTQKRRGR